MILNIGCGNNTYGDIRIDINPNSAATDIYDVDKGLQLSDNIIDEIYERNILEHLRNVGFHLDECYRVLKQGGKITVITDNAECQRYYTFGTHTGRYERLHPGDHHFSIFTKKHLQNHFEKAGFKDINIQYIKTDTIGRCIDLVTFQHPRIKVTATKRDE